MIKIVDKKNCMGCSACSSICPTNCITMTADSEGFLYPKVNESKCINCNLCVKTCPLLNLKTIHRDHSKVYGGYNKNNDNRFNSSSGGIFYLLASHIINNGGIVFGASFNEKNKVIHIKVDKKDDLPKLMTSKYVQSEIGNTYKEVKKYLMKDITVLFSGTPCQISGLYHFLKRSYSNLITQDIICHGVPSPKLWEYHLNNIGIKGKTDIIDVKNINFRDKNTGWENYSFSYSRNQKKYVISHNKDIYMKSFLSNYNLRPSCYFCEFKEGKSGADLTLGDFWGVQKLGIFEETNKGISLVIVNSNKGENLLKEISNKCVLREVDYNDSFKYNKAYFESVKIPKNRSKYFKEINQENFVEVTKKYTKISFFRKTKILIKKFLKKLLRK